MDFEMNGNESSPISPWSTIMQFQLIIALPENQFVLTIAIIKVL